MIEIAFAPAKLPTSGALALLIAEGAAPSGLWAAADKATGGGIMRALEAARFTGAKGKSATILAPGGGLSRVVAVGLGKPEDLTSHAVEEAGGRAATALAQDGTAALAADSLDAAQAAAAALGASLARYRFDRYRTKEAEEDKPKLARLSVLAADLAAAEAAWRRGRAVAEGVAIARDLVSEPANVLFPAEMARRCQELTRLGLEVEVMEPKELEALGFGALLGVAMGSAREARMVVMRWRGPGASGTPLAFVGKGVTFDTGGISIKPAGGMEDMKWDMAGSAAVVGLMAALAGRRAAVDAVGIVGLVENMPSATAQRPGDVVRTHSGQTVEVINTDAEGRLVLADLLSYCRERFKPRFMVDLATLTGAIIISLGHEHAGLFCNDDALAERLLKAGRASGEKLWRMPLDEGYDKLIKSDIADMKNVGGRPGGAITAAQFLARFVGDCPWAHLDIAGMAWATKDAPVTPKGATAFGVRLLDRMVADAYEGSAGEGGAA
ncbi:MAG TPA: leucyl aminopeptidase [Acetobacteraceae bacterium]|nr:leucyl aminopeptidase [Acetobacteraceae bacterium]